MGLVHVKDDPLLISTMSSKVQAYMAAGLPILMACKGNSAGLVEMAEAGLLCAPEDPESIAQTVEKFFTMPPRKLEKIGINGKKFYEHRLSLGVGVRKFEEIFKSVVNDREGHLNK